MGFALECFLALDAQVLPLYERLLPGGSVAVRRARQDGLPDGWVLPHPNRIDGEWDYVLELVDGWQEPDTADTWRRAARVPDGSVPFGALTDETLQMASLLSLAAPAGVLYMNDTTHAGVLLDEHALLFVDGRLRAGAGFDRGGVRQFELHDGRFRPVPDVPLRPVIDCLAVMDTRFTGTSVFEGYLPRSADPPDTLADPPGRLAPVPIDPPTVDAWAPYFPVLAW